jgi:hypothetical protein
MKKLTIILSFLILTSTTFATSVGGSIGGWNIVSQVGSGIGQKLTATKEVIVNGASKVITGTANITPNPTGVAKFMARVGGVALVVDAMDLILDGVDYVMDPVNNTVTYKTKPLDEAPDSNFRWLGQGALEGVYFDNLTTACKAHISKLNYKPLRFHQIAPPAGCTTYNVDTQRYDTNVPFTRVIRDKPFENNEDKPITIPLSSIGSQVIEQAEKDIKAGNPASPAVVLTRAVAEAQGKEAELDDKKAQPIVDQFQKNPEYPSVNEGEGTITTPEITDPITGEVTPPQTSSIAMQFPKDCEWFPQLCLFIDWMQKPEELDEPDLPTEEIEKKEIDEELIKISSSSCPAPIDVNIPLPVFNTTYTDSISVSEYCPKIEKLAPVLQLLAFVLAIMIIKDI